MAREAADGPEAPPRRLLPVAGREPAERADAARNRQRILAAAQRILAASGCEGLSMEAVAREADVGVGTCYRRFGDRSKLAYALLDARERELQETLLAGPPPLGPGAPPHERIRAFLHALVDRFEEQQDLLLIAETDTPYARFSGAYAVYHIHLATLLESIRPGTDVHYLADALLAPLAANLYLHQRRDQGMSTDRIKAGLDNLLTLDLDLDHSSRPVEPQGRDHSPAGSPAGA